MVTKSKEKSTAGLIEHFFHRVDEERAKCPSGRFPEEVEKTIRRLRSSLVPKLDNPYPKDPGAAFYLLLRNISEKIPPRDPPGQHERELNEIKTIGSSLVTEMSGGESKEEDKSIFPSCFDQYAIHGLVQNFVDAGMKGCEQEAKDQIWGFFHWLTDAPKGRKPDMTTPAYRCAQEHYIDGLSWMQVAHRYCPDRQIHQSHRCSKDCSDRIRFSATPLKEWVHKRPAVLWLPIAENFRSITGTKQLESLEKNLVDDLVMLPHPLPEYEQIRFKLYVLLLNIGRVELGIKGQGENYLRLVEQFGPPATPLFDPLILCRIVSEYFERFRGAEERRIQVKSELKSFLNWMLSYPNTVGRPEKKRSEAYKWARLKYIENKTWRDITDEQCPKKGTPPSVPT